MTETTTTVTTIEYDQNGRQTKTVEVRTVTKGKKK